jgi:Uma2 family endonuclease
MGATLILTERRSSDRRKRQRFHDAGLKTGVPLKTLAYDKWRNRGDASRRRAVRITTKSSSPRAACLYSRIMVVARNQHDRFTYADYATWPDEERWELIDGRAWAMTPAPSTRHQRVLLSLGHGMKRQLAGHSCQPFMAPTDVVLSEYDVVQPDLLVVCDRTKITEANIQGAPDFIAEVLSPTTSLKDRREKLALYEKFGVKEYLLVHPTENHAERRVLDPESSRYAAATLHAADETIALVSLPGVTIDLKKIFAED